MNRLASRSRSAGARRSLAVALVALLTATGCARTRRVEYIREKADAYALRPKAEVEVLLDRRPDRPFTDTGQFVAHTASSERSISLIKARAAEAGIDGIYWIDCDTAFNGECTAKGFVYVDRPEAPTLGGSPSPVLAVAPRE
ncbi:MAG: hypothetical protein U0414_05030 [Polyangiaceae bacterium]